MASAAVMAVTKWSISGLQKKRSGLRLLTSPTERAMQKESPGGEAGASPKEKNVQRDSRRPDTIPKRETRYHPKA
jgi:hypothetical protein